LNIGLWSVGLAFDGAAAATLAGNGLGAGVAIGGAMNRGAPAVNSNAAADVGG